MRLSTSVFLTPSPAALSTNEGMSEWMRVLFAFHVCSFYLYQVDCENRGEQLCFHRLADLTVQVRKCTQLISLPL